MQKRKISASIVADSVDERGNRITSFILTYPRMIHSELMTHRMFSRNAASSRAIPFATMVKSIENDPFIPIAWQRDHKGMQGTEYLSGDSLKAAIHNWLVASKDAIKIATTLNENGVTKQLCNRLLEPFQWYTCLVTATEFDNFYELRCPKYYGVYKSQKDLLVSNVEERKRPFRERPNESGAEIHIQSLAEAMWDAHNESKPKELKTGEWHIPFGDKLDPESIAKAIGFKTSNYDWYNKELWSKIQIATARCARLSYMTFNNEIDYKKDVSLHAMLLESKHMSPFEHCARAMSDDEYNDQFEHVYPRVDSEGKFVKYFVDKAHGWCRNFRGFIQYRYLKEVKPN